MSDDEHSESEFYYPEDTESNWSFQDEQIDQGSEVFNEYTDSQEDIDSFVKAQKSKNTVKKTTSDMNNFYRYLAQINKRHINILNLQANELDHLLAKFFKDVRKINGEDTNLTLFLVSKEAFKGSSLIASQDITSSSTESLKSHDRFLLLNAKI